MSAPKAPASAPSAAPSFALAEARSASPAAMPAETTATPDPADLPGERWADAVLALLLLAIDPPGIGLALHAAAGPVRDRWLALLRQQLGAGTPLHRLPLHIRDDRLLGGLDLTATLQAGRPVAQRGLLADSHGGLLLLAMAERLDSGTVARLAAAMDRGVVVAERDGVALSHPARFGVVALDESESPPPGLGPGLGPDEALPAALRDRLALLLDLGPVPPRLALDSDDAFLMSPAELAAARQRHVALQVPDALLHALCTAAAALGVDSPRACLQALCVARAHAALHEQDEVLAEDMAVAARLVLAPRATRLPAAPPPDQPEDAAAPEEPPPADPADPAEPPPEPEDAAPPPADEAPDVPPDADDELPDLPPGALDELVLQAALAALPPDLLASLKASQAGQAARQAARAAGVSGALQKAGKRGRPVGVRRGEPRAGQRLNVIETLRAAVPWQKLRRRGEAPVPGAPRRVEVRADDFHVTQLRQRRETTTLFAVDASGSAAVQRLAEAKGAVELLLADCYVRRDKVAVLAFRGRAAELLLPPTRSLVRAKRALSGLPGGGGTPLAAGIDALAVQAAAARRRGDTAVAVLLTDGRANVALDGTGGRARAEADALAAARRLRALGAAVLVIDTSPQPSPQAARVAEAAAAVYLPLPYAGAQALSRAVRAAADGSGRGV